MNFCDYEVDDIDITVTPRGQHCGAVKVSSVRLWLRQLVSPYVGVHRL